VDFFFTAFTAKKRYICGQKFYYSSTKIMATFKAEVYAHQKRADGTYNIKIRGYTPKRGKKYNPDHLLRDKG